MMRLLPLVALFALGCGSDASRFRALLAKGDHVLDCRRLPGLGDAQLRELANSPHRDAIRELYLDGTAITDDGIADMPRLPALKLFAAAGTGLTDAGVAHLANVTDLEALRLDGTRITDLGLAHVGRMNNLRILSLQHCGVTDHGMAHLRPLTKLVDLHLDRTQVTGWGVRVQVAGIDSLRYLSIWQAKVSDADADALRERCPDLTGNR